MRSDPSVARASRRAAQSIPLPQPTTNKARHCRVLFFPGLVLYCRRSGWAATALASCGACRQLAPLRAGAERADEQRSRCRRALRGPTGRSHNPIGRQSGPYRKPGLQATDKTTKRQNDKTVTRKLVGAESFRHFGMHWPWRLRAAERRDFKPLPSSAHRRYDHGLLKAMRLRLHSTISDGFVSFPFA